MRGHRSYTCKEIFASESYILDQDGAARPFDGEVDDWSKAVSAAPRYKDAIKGLYVTSEFLGFNLRKKWDPPGNPLLWETLLTCVCQPSGAPAVSVLLERHSSVEEAIRCQQQVFKALVEGIRNAGGRTPISFNLMRSSGRHSVLRLSEAGWSFRGPEIRALEEPEERYRPERIVPGDFSACVLAGSS